MADQTITIKFTPPTSPGGSPGWTNDPDSVEITKAGATIEVVLSLLGTGTLVYNTTAINWDSQTSSSQFSVSPQGGGTSVTITDQDSVSGSFGFTVNVLYNGTPYTSPDPTIINKVPS
jgi:DP-EP family